MAIGTLLLLIGLLPSRKWATRGSHPRALTLLLAALMLGYLLWLASLWVIGLANRESPG